MGQQMHMTMLEDLKRAAWARTSPVSGQMNAWEFRKRHSPFGWELDYIISRTAGGSTDPENLQALHWKATAARTEVPSSLVKQESREAA